MAIHFEDTLLVLGKHFPLSKSAHELWPRSRTCPVLSQTASAGRHPCLCSLKSLRKSMLHSLCAGPAARPMQIGDQNSANLMQIEAIC